VKIGQPFLGVKSYAIVQTVNMKVRLQDFVSLIVSYQMLLGAVLPAQSSLIGAGPGQEESEEIRELRVRVKDGDSEAAFELGRRLADGDQVSRNFPEAELLLKKALESGNEAAAERLGKLLLETSQGGADVDRAAKGLRFLRDCSATQDSCALTLGQFYASGIFVPADFDKAEALFLEAVKLGNPDGKFRLGEIYSGEAGFENRADVEKAVKLLEEGFQEGSFEAGRFLVKLLREGKKVPRDEKRAFAVAREAAERGDAAAMLFLGDLYEDGSGVDADSAKARESYLAAAEAGNATAQTKMGVLLLEDGGEGGGDAGQAQEWFEKAADQGFAFAHLNLALLHTRNSSSDHASLDPVTAGKAVDHLVVAATAGLAEAQNLLGSWYRDGSYVRRDLVAAAAWLRPAAVSGNLSAKVNLAQVLEVSAVDQESLRMAFALYAESADAGHPLGHFNYARLLLSGSVAPVDPALACAHLQAAVDAGLKPAERPLEELKNNLADEQQKRARDIRERLRIIPAEE